MLCYQAVRVARRYIIYKVARTKEKPRPARHPTHAVTESRKLPKQIGTYVHELGACGAMLAWPSRVQAFQLAPMEPRNPEYRERAGQASMSSEVDMATWMAVNGTSRNDHGDVFLIWP